jgi:hypothetical protein
VKEYGAVVGEVHLVEVVHVELPYERGEAVVPIITREDMLF